MKNITKFQNKKVLVLGTAKSGYSAALLLRDLGASVVINDFKKLEDNKVASELIELGFEVVSGYHPLELLDDCSYVVKNPGIPYHNPMVEEALKRKLPIVTEIELAYLISEAPIIGITGSNGKTTTTTLLYEILKEGGKNPLLAGNIGTVACEVARTATKDQVLLLELSSFQLMGTDEFRPHIGVLLNLFDAHIDYHGDFESYRQAKLQMFKNQTKDDFAVLNAGDQRVMEKEQVVPSNKVYFSAGLENSKGAYCKGGSIFWNEEKIIDLCDVVLPGAHNVENILACVSVAKLSSVSNDAIQNVLKRFSGVKHRLQYVKTVNDRKFYNDSKATNILATEKALSAFKQPTILLAGGLDRGNEFDELAPFMDHVKVIVTFGETAKKIERVAKEKGIKVIKRVDNVDTAVQVAYEQSSEGDIILLSPACASWDQYPSFEIRGDIFIQAVHKLN